MYIVTFEKEYDDSPNIIGTLTFEKFEDAIRDFIKQCIKSKNIELKLDKENVVKVLATSIVNKHGYLYTVEVYENKFVYAIDAEIACVLTWMREIGVNDGYDYKQASDFDWDRLWLEYIYLKDIKKYLNAGIPCHYWEYAYIISSYFDENSDNLCLSNFNSNYILAFDKIKRKIIVFNKEDTAHYFCFNLDDKLTLNLLKNKSFEWVGRAN